MDPVARFLEQQIDQRRMPGAVARVSGPDGTLGEWVLGRAALEPAPLDASIATLYDLASLTKPLCTALALAMLEQQGSCVLDCPVVEWLPELDGSPYANVSLLQIGAHGAGFPAWRPLYLRGGTTDAFLAAIATEPPEAPEPTRYSDLGYLCLGVAVERIAGRSLDSWFADSVAGPLGLSGIGFATVVDTSNAAPTERGNVYERTLAGAAGEGHGWRTELIRGEVHDGNAHALGGVAGHCGLFGILDDVAALARELLRPRTLPLGDRARRRLFEEAFPGARRSLGFVLADASDAARGVFDNDAPGHVGFAGPSLWFEPDRGRVYVLLTNRVHPVVDTADFQPVRAGFHRAARDL